LAKPSVRFVNSPDAHKPVGYSHAAEVSAGGKMVFISGQVALDKDGNLVGPGDMRAQARQVFENLKAALASVGGDFSHVVKMTYFVTDASQFPVVREVRNQYLDTDNPPASTGVAVRQLVREEWLIEVEATAVVPD
jgi:reactive intermediate/imine deaminase